MSSQPAYDHLPLEGKRRPVNTYRLQLTPDFRFEDAAGLLDYLQNLGVTDLFLSPILQAAPGSTHGYNVVDHSRVSEDLGGEEAFIDLATRAHEAGLGVVVDIVPNHMATPKPIYYNRQMWSVLRYGPDSPFAKWFDIDTGGDPLLLPILGKPIGKVLEDGELELVDLEAGLAPGLEPQRVLRYYDHVFPLADGTADLPLEVLLESQNYRLAYWEITNEELNYRRFFDVGSLVGLRVEDPEVFEATHAKIFDLVERGFIDGLRIDHSDGLANPAEYFSRLRKATGGIWTVTEKILAPDEELPPSWQIAGTTGYDCAFRIGQLGVEPRAALPLGALMRRLTGDVVTDYPAVVQQAKREVLETSLQTELYRLANLAYTVCDSDIRLRDTSFRALRDSLTALIVAMPQYRTYFVPGEPLSSSTEAVLATAGAAARDELPPERHDALDILLALLMGKPIGANRVSEMEELASLQIGFQQVCGATTAKGVEDTAFYRWTHLTSLCEVGGEPAFFSISPEEYHSWAKQMQEQWPLGMTNLSTHDSKRSEDVRAQMSIISRYPHDWATLVGELRKVSLSYRPATLQGAIENLIYQTVGATWSPDGPIEAERLKEYIRKSAREQKQWTNWVSPADDLERETLEFAANLLADPLAEELFEGWFSSNREEILGAVLGAKALQLMSPGVADTYQGCETLRYSLVDPDNRRPVDFAALAKLLSRLDDTGESASLREKKLRLTANLLRLRRELPEVFASPEGTYQPLPSTSSSLVAFGRGKSAGLQVLCLVDLDGPSPLGSKASPRSWHNAGVVLPEGSWISVFSGKHFSAGEILLDDLFAEFPVEVLRLGSTS